MKSNLKCSFINKTIVEKLEDISPYNWIEEVFKTIKIIAIISDKQI